jgi:diphthamide biosynthesis protein 2
MIRFDVLTRGQPGEFLLQRSWQGLERRLGQDAPSLLEQGRSGIASGYGER